MVKDSTLTATSIQSATITQNNTNSDDDVNVIDQGLIEIIIGSSPLNGGVGCSLSDPRC